MMHNKSLASGDSIVIYASDKTWVGVFSKIEDSLIYFWAAPEYQYVEKSFYVALPVTNIKSIILYQETTPMKEIDKILNGDVD